MNLGLKDKIALITGTNNPQGIGAASALAFANEGVRLALIYKKIPHKYDESKTGTDGVDRYFKANSGGMKDVEQQLLALNADYFILESDISNERSVKDIFDRVIGRFGKVDILVNNAAAADDGDNDTIETITQSVIDETFAVNVRGTLLMTREFVARRGDYGRIINFSTDAAQAFPGTQITYAASKAAIEAFTRGIAIGVGKYGITVNCIAPGPTQTGWIDDALADAVLPQIPLGRLIQPRDIAETLVFLASERAAMLTGQVIKVSGGHAL